MIMSGMRNLEQTKDNLACMKNFKPLSQVKMAAIEKVKEIFNSKHLISCTTCRYCTAGCPKQIPVPDLFACMNMEKLFQGWSAGFYYSNQTAEVYSIIRDTVDAVRICRMTGCDGVDINSHGGYICLMSSLQQRLTTGRMNWEEAWRAG